nr:murein biosynthesis integral membrane protein MurJ [Corynebacterium lactis]
MPAESAPDLTSVRSRSGRSGSSGRPAGAAGASGATSGSVAGSSAAGTASGNGTRDGASGPSSPRGDAGAGASRAKAATVVKESGAEQSDSDVVASTGSMAIATLISRITGFLRNLLIGATMGPAIASAFNVANTLPNLITEIVLGAVLTSLVVPVLVRAEKEDPDRGAAFIRRLLTVSLSLLLVVTIAAVIGAPFLTRLSLNADGKVNVALATAFAFLLLPQIIFYGIFALLMAVLNTKGIFKPGAWAPVANNVVAIVTLLLYWQLPGKIPHNSAGLLTDLHILLLGLGTTLGVVIQAVIMIPYLRKAGIDLRPLWGIDDRIKQFSGMGIAIVTYVAISQAGYFITTQIASTASEAAPTIYQQAWLLLQVPYGIIGVTLLTAIMPRLSRNAADGNDKAVVRDLSVGTRLTMIALVPIVAFFTAFGRPIAIGLFAYLEFPRHTAEILGWTLSFSAFSLIPYAIVLLHLRVFYAREEAWTPTFIILGITIVKVILSYLAPILASNLETVVVLLGAANGFGFLAGAIIGFLLLRRTLGHLDSKATIKTVLWALGASIVGVVVASLVYLFTDSGLFDFFGSFGFFLRTCITGVVFLIGTGVVLAQAPLAEVRVLGGFLGRIPGLRRFAPKPHDAADAVEDRDAMEREQGFAADAFSISPSSLIGEATGLANEGFTASPLLPPMPTEGSRPVRYVPGEMVSGGRFRLRSEIATYPGLRLWRAMDMGDPDHGDVALIFVDTITLPYRGGLPSDAATRIANTTNELRNLAGPGMSRIHSVAKTRTEVLIAADWTSSVGAHLLEQAAHPDALALAAVYLAETVAAAHESGRVLGLDDKPERLRISSDGRLFDAFPVVLPDASRAADYRALVAVTSSLFDGVAHVPEDIRAAIAKAKNANPDDPDAEVSPARTLAEDLRRAALGPESSEFPVIRTDNSGDRTGSGASKPGLVRRVAGRTRAFSTGAMVVGVVIVGAVVAGAVFGLVNRSSDAPITPDSVRRGPEAAQKAAEGLGASLPIASVAEWQPATDNPEAGPDNPDAAGRTVDDDPNSYWVTSTYLSQFGPSPSGFKPGVGIRVTLAQPGTPSHVRLVATSGAKFEIRGLKDPTSNRLEDTVLLGSGRMGHGPTNIPVDSKGQNWTDIVILVTEMPEAKDSIANMPVEEIEAGRKDPLVGDISLARSNPSQLVPVAIGDVDVLD